MDNFWISHRREFAKMDKDIQRKQLKYHNKRVMVSKEFTFDAAHHLHCYEGKCKTYMVTHIKLYLELVDM